MSDKLDNPLLSTRDPIAELNWSMLLELQVATYLPFELHFFFNWLGWHKAKRVLDAGCGNGYFLSQLRRYFPEKSYTGLDLSEEHVASARLSRELADVEFVHCDFLGYRPSQLYDVVLMRLIVQHMSGFDKIFEQLERTVRKGGSVVIIEPEPNLFLNYPETPIFENLLAAYAKSTKANNLNRANLSQMGEAISHRHKEWVIVQDRVIVAPSLGPFHASPLVQIFTLWIDIIERSRALSFDFSAAREEIRKWSNLEVSYSQIGVQLIEVVRTGAST